jgi:hypothetical protein
MSAANIQHVWDGKTVAIFASGPSMSQEIAEQCRGHYKTIAINNQAIDCAPWADVIWATDYKWWHTYGQKVAGHPGRKFHVLQGQTYEGCETLLSSFLPFDDRSTHISTGQNSGYAALCLAVKLGAARALLFGYDMQTVGGHARRFDYPKDLNARHNFARWILNFERLAPELKRRGVEVLNCTPGSALRCFPPGELMRCANVA